MENKELKEKSLPTEQVTTTEKKTKPKDPGRIAAGKNLQNITKKREKQKRLAAKIKKFQKKNKDEIPKRKQSRRIIFTDANSFSGQYCCFSCGIILQEKRVDELCQTREK